MYDTLGENMTPSSGPADAHCPICRKTFAKESTRKRHYYYCRSKRPEKNTSRRRSCVACIRAKTRCSWLANTAIKICTRCNERGILCEQDPSSRPSAGQADSTASVTPRRRQDIGARRSSTSSTLHQPVDAVRDLDLSLPSTFDVLSDLEWNFDPTQIEMIDFHDNSIEKQALSPVPNTTSTIPDTLVTGISLLQSNTMDRLSPHPFRFRTVVKSNHVPLVSLIRRILRSYPFMILHDGTLPPFLNPQMYYWARTGKGPRQQTLLNCVSLIQIFRTRTEANKNLIWSLIRCEQERIFAEYLAFDKWELLAALQALLFYCLLRLHDDVVVQDGFDASLLHTVNLVCSTLSLLVKCDCDLPTEPSMAWRDWIFNESRRRTGLVFRAIKMLVDISSAITCYPGTGFGLLPLPSKSTLWVPGDVSNWKTAFELCCKERTLYGLSDVGILAKLQLDESGIIHESGAQWEEWTAEVGEIGTLAMIMGDLLS